MSNPGCFHDSIGYHTIICSKTTFNRVEFGDLQPCVVYKTWVHETCQVRRFNRTKTTVSIDGQKNWKKREDFLVCTITDSIKIPLFGLLVLGW